MVKLVNRQIGKRAIGYMAKWANRQLSRWLNGQIGFPMGGERTTNQTKKHTYLFSSNVLLSDTIYEDGNVAITGWNELCGVTFYSISKRKEKI